MTTAQIISIVIFVVVMALIVSEKIHRTTAALCGAVALILFGILDFDTSVEHIDFNTLGVLVGMMLFVGVVKGSGIFEYLAIKSAEARTGHPWLIMLVFSIITALLSALLDNVTTILLIGPVTYTDLASSCIDINPNPVLHHRDPCFEYRWYRNAHRRSAQYHDRIGSESFVLRLHHLRRAVRSAHHGCRTCDLLLHVRTQARCER